MADHASNPADVRAEVEDELSELVETAAAQERDRIASSQPDGYGVPSELMTRLLSATEVRLVIPADRADVFRAIADPDTYPEWLAGAQRIRHVDAAFPARGGRFDHEVGPAKGLTVDDDTVSAGARPPERLDLEVHVGPFTGWVEFHLHEVDDGTEVVLRESATGPWRLAMPALRIALYLRNRGSLHRLRQRFAAPDTIDAEEGPMASDYAADITLVEVLHDLRERGYTGEFRLERDGAVFCVVCGISQRAQELIAHGMRRVEGASDPGDEAMVLGIACRGCGERGAIVLRYGPEAGVADATVLAGIDQGQILTIPPLD